MIQPKFSWPLTQADIQSILATSSIRKRRFLGNDNPFNQESVELFLDLPGGVQLHGYYTKSSGPDLAILLHGWEGSAQSSYILATANQLYKKGVSVFRLQFRDHGDTHHLNEEIFHSCRIQEVVDAVAKINKLYQPRNLFLAGFSLGGNFALRVALHSEKADIPLKHVVAVSPAIDPKKSLAAIESALPIYRWYFLKKWKNSLLIKSTHFPDKYSFGKNLKNRSLLDLTKVLVENYTDFNLVDDYFDGYSVAGDRLKSLSVSTHIITAEDDPVIPVDDFYKLELPDNVKLTITPHGGHCGFISNLSLRGWVEEQISREFT